jgi:hypothetical protein
MSDAKALLPVVHFESELFAPFLPEDCQVNPEAYGAELAMWMARKLAERGVYTSYPNFEDWGWFIEYVREPDDEFWLICVNRDGAKHLWTCALEAKGKSLFGRKKPPIERARPLLEAVEVILTAERAVKNVNWSESR